MPQVPPDVTRLRPGQVAERAGVAVSTLHYYESLGLIRSRRTAGGRREYERDVLRRIAFVRAAQRAGVSLARVREALAELPGDRPPTRADWARISRRWRAELDERIAALVALRDDLTGCVGCGCLSLRACPVVNPGDVRGREGPGAPGLRLGGSERGARG